MFKLNLTAENDCQQAIKDYLENNVSEVLAEKINNGIKIEKDGKTLIKKKTLSLFWEYASMKAQEMKTAYVANDTVFGWAIHYFEEDGFVGKLYNEDGSEYIRPQPKQKPIQRAPAPTIQAKPVPQPPKQFTLFDMLPQPETPNEERVEEAKEPVPKPCNNDEDDEVTSPASEEVNEDTDEEFALNVDSETGEILSPQSEQPEGSPLYQKYMYFQNQNPQAVIAYRLGDFFEIFGDNAIKVSNRLDLTLTGRDCGLDERVPMVGFPFHAADSYLRKIAAFSPLIIVEDDVATPYAFEQNTTVSSPITEELTPTEDEEDDFDDFQEELAMQQFFDKEALLAIYELFDGNIDMQ